MSELVKYFSLSGGFLYTGECQPGDRVATSQDVAAIVAAVVKKYDDAIEEHLLAERSARGYTVREPSLYLNSSNVRWASDAQDWIAHVDEVMAYGLEVQNQFTATGEAPDLEDFKSGIPKIEWSMT